jgi:expansin
VQYKLAISGANWAGSQACGGCVRITGPRGNAITAMVVDQCPGCGANHLDLFPDAFAALDDPARGVIGVSWEWAACAVAGPVQLRAKEGASQWWFALQVVNAVVRVAAMEVSTDRGRTWQATQRTDYNYFTKPGNGGFGTQTVAVRVTGVNGKTLVVADVNVNARSVTTAAGNLG